MNNPNPERATVEELVSRCREMAKKAPLHSPTPEVLERTAAHERGLSIVAPLQENHQDDDTEPRFSGSIAETMFDLDDYGERLCEDCYEPIDNKRSHSRFCSDSCRKKSWNNNNRSYRNPHA